MPQQENKTTQRTYTRAEVDGIVEKAIEAERARVLVVPSDEELLELGKDYAKKYNHPVLNKHSYEIDATAFAAGYKTALQSQRTISEDVLREVEEALEFTLENNGSYCGRNKSEKALKALRDAVGGE